MKAASSKQPPTETTPFMQKQKEPSLYDKLFKRQENPDFAHHLELAVRAGFVIAVFRAHGLYGVGLKSLLSDVESVGFTDSFEDMHFHCGDTYIMLIYALYRTVGETAYYAWSSFLGVVFGCVYSWIMFVVFPGGVSHDHSPHHPAWIFGHVMGVVFIVGTLFLNLSLNLRMFALCAFVQHWMAFLQPGKGSGLHEWSASALSHDVWGATYGCALAVLITLCPYPLMAASKARRTAKDLVKSTGSSWSLAIDLFAATCQEPYMRGDLEHHYDLVWKSMHVLDGHLANSCWEGMGRFTMHRTRHMLSAFEEAMRETAERLTGVVVMISDLHDFAASASLAPLLHDVVDRASLLLKELLDIACEGRLPEEQGDVEGGGWERERLQTDAQALKRSMEALASGFHASKTAEGVAVLSNRFLNEDALMSAISNYGRITTEFAEYMCNPSFDEDLPKPRTFVAGLAENVASIFDTNVIFDEGNLNFAVRNSISILLCFYAGYVGYSQMLPHFSPGTASTASVLLSMHQGSSIQRHLARLQGVCVGLLAGQFFYALFGWCEVWAGMVRQIFAVGFLGAVLGGYFESDKYSLVALYTAAFSSKYILRECSSAVENPAKLVHSIVEVVLCTFIMGVVDEVFSGQLPSKAIYHGMVGIWLSMAEMSGAVYSMSPPALEDLSSVQESIYAAKDLSQEAVKEFRLWKMAWRDDILAEAARLSFRVRSQLSCMVRIINHSKAGGSGGCDALAKLLELPEFIAFSKIAFEAIDAVPKMLAILRCESEKQWQQFYKPALRDDGADFLHLHNISKHLKLAVAAANNDLGPVGGTQFPDPTVVARLANALHSVEGICICIRKFQFYIFQTL